MPEPGMLVRLSGLGGAFDGVRVLHGIDLAVARGEAVGMVGESGSGKSVTWLAALGLLPAKAKVTGSAIIDGQELVGAPGAVLDSLRGGRAAMIFQDPASALNPVLSVGRQITEALALHTDLSGGSLRAEAKRLLDLVGIPDAGRRIDAYPHEFSGGQNQRVMIAMALAGKPDLLIADEPTTALDVTIQAQVLDLLDSLRRQLGMAVLLITHDLGVVAQWADRVTVMYAGRVVEQAPVRPFFASPRHPYARGLLDASVGHDGEAHYTTRRLNEIPGSIASAVFERGCPFAPRCPVRIDACRLSPPPLVALAPDHRVACIVTAGTDHVPAVG